MSGRKKLSRQLLALLLGYTLALSIPITLVNAWLGYVQETHRQQAQVEAVMSLFGLQLRKAVWDFDEPSVHDVLAGLRHFPALQSVEVIAPDLRASYVKANTDRAQAGRPRSYPLLAPNGSMVMGELVLRLDEASLDRLVWGGLGKTALVIAIELLLLASVIFLLVERRVAAPVLALSRHVRELTSDRLDEPAPMPQAMKHDELHELAGGITRLQQQLRAQLAERDAIARTVQDSAAQLKLMADSIPHQLWTAAADGTLTYASQHALEYFGMSFEQLAQHNLASLAHPADWSEAEARWTQALRAGIPFRADLRLRRFDDAYRWHALVAVPQRDEAGRIVKWFGSSTDIAERKQNEEDLVQTQKMTAIGQLAGGIAHDFNNQLTVILGYTELLDRSVTDARTRELTAGILQSAKRCRDLTRNLLAFSRKQQVTRVPVDVHSLVDETIALLERSFDKRIQLIAELNASSAIIRGDASQLQNALLNLALNARDAMPEGGVLRLSTELVSIASDASDRSNHFAQLGPGMHLCLTVSDSGSGMPDAVKQRIFEPFFTTKPAGEGTGMGLPSVYGTVQSHGGTIIVESELGRGSTFRLFFPLAMAHELAAPAPPAASVAPEATGLRVLVVEDEPGLRALLEDALRRAGHEPLLAATGEEALHVYAQSFRAIDVVILDMIMPGLSGLETYRGLKRVSADVKVIVSSGFDSGGAIDLMLEEGALGFLQKPFDQGQLLAMLALAASPAQNSV